MTCPHIFYFFFLFKVPPCFLSQQNIPSLCCIFPSSSLESVISPWSPGSFYWWMVFRNQNLVVGVLVDTGVSLLLDILSLSSVCYYGTIHIYICFCIYPSVHISIWAHINLSNRPGFPLLLLVTSFSDREKHCCHYLFTYLSIPRMHIKKFQICLWWFISSCLFLFIFIFNIYSTSYIPSYFLPLKWYFWLWSHILWNFFLRLILKFFIYICI